MGPSYPSFSPNFYFCSVSRKKNFCFLTSFILQKGDSEEHGILKVGNLAQHASSRLCEEISSYGGKKNEKTRNGEKVSGSISEASSISKMEEQEMASASSEEDRDQEELRADFIDHMEQRFLRGMLLDELMKLSR